MKINSIYIDGFGIFNKLSLENLPRGLVVFRGNNEAGKSTLLAFIRAIFFGFSDGRTKDPLAEPHSGGRIEITNTDGNRYIIERKMGKKGGRVKVTGLDDNLTGSDKELQRLLVGANRELFKHIYAFSLGELQQIETLQADSIKDAIYGASTGTAMMALPKSISSIQNSLDELYKPNGKNPAINQKLTALEDIQKQLRQAQDYVAGYDNTYIGLVNTEKEIESVRIQISLLDVEQKQVEDYLKLWQDWLTWQACEQNLNTLFPVVEVFPENGISNLDNLIQLRQERHTVVSRLHEEIKILESEKEQLVIQEIILNEEDTILRLYDCRSIYTERLQSISINEERRERIEQEIEQHLQSLGSDWTEARVLSVERSLFKREEIRRFQSLFDDLRLKKQTQAEVVDARQREYEAALQEEEAAKQFAESIKVPEHTHDEKVVHALQAGRDEMARIVEELPKVRKIYEETKEFVTKSAADIEPDWTPQFIEKLNTSIHIRQRVCDFETSLNKTEKEISEARILEKTNRQVLEDAKKQKEYAESELRKMFFPGLSVEAIWSKKAAIRNLRGLLMEEDILNNEIMRHEERLADKREDHEKLIAIPPFNPARPFLIVFIFMAVLLILAPAVAVPFERVNEGILLSILFAFVAAYVFREYKKVKRRANMFSDDHERKKLYIEKEITSIEDKIAEAINKKADLESEIMRHAKVLEIEGEVENKELDMHEIQIEEVLKLLDKQSRKKEEIDRIGRQIGETTKALHHVSDTVAKFVEDKEKLLKEWKSFLGSLKLNTDLEPSTVQHIFTRIDAVRQEIKKLCELKERLHGLENARKKYINLMESIPELKEPARHFGLETLTSLDRFFEAEKAKLRLKQQKDLAMQAFEEKQRVRELMEAAFNEADSVLQQIIEQQTLAQEEWKEWLTQHGFSESLSTETALEALRIIEKLMYLFNLREQTIKVIKECQDYVDEYNNLALDALRSVGMDDTGKEYIMVQINKLKEALDKNRKDLLVKDEVERQIQKKQIQLQASEVRLKECQDEIAGLLNAGKSSDESEFRRRGRAFEERNRIAAEMQAAQRNLILISGESDMAILVDTLRNLNKEKLLQAQADLIKKKEELDRQLKELHETRADLKARLDSMVSSDEVSRLRMQEETLLEEIELLAQKWSSYAIAQYLLKEARVRFEKEQQPAVIRDASAFFNAITGRSYPSILSPIGTNTIEVITTDGKRMDPGHLSRGTAEQLYLAIRFGYISNFASNSEPLPVIMDDILVNFDPIRAEHTAISINKLTKTHQVLFFTCHPETVKIFQKHNPDASLYNIESGQISMQQKG